MPRNAEAIADAVQAWCATPESLQLLRLKPEEGELTWSDGGCGVLAMGVRDVFPETKVWGIFGDALNEKYTIWHIFVELDGVLFDAGGTFGEPSPIEAAKAWASHHQTAFTRCGELDCDDWMPRDSRNYAEQIRPVGDVLRGLTIQRT